MRMFGADNWLKAPLDRDVIARWTVGAGDGMQYALELPAPVDPERFQFLVLGDSGDSEAAGPHVSPQDAVGIEMAREAALPGSRGLAAFVVHTGDVIYMTGERRLYERNFRRPYAAFLTPESTVDNLVFRIPFLPVPGNHDYYDLRGWLRWLARIPILGAGARALSHELFAFSLPEGGSGMGRAYMQAFVDAHADTREAALPYRPGAQTKLPNRYYRFSYGMVDFFALDSNTLEGPPPWTDTSQVRSDAAARIQELEARAQALDRRLRHEQLALDRWRHAHREQAAQDAAIPAALADVTGRVGAEIARLQDALRLAEPAPIPCREVRESMEAVGRHWTEASSDMAAAHTAAQTLSALQQLDEAGDEVCVFLGEAEKCLAVLPEGEDRTRILKARDSLQAILHQWAVTVAEAPPELSLSLHRLSEEALDVQRELALERRRLRYRPEDYDRAQLDWLDRSLAESMRDRPEAWRIVYLHHPLYTTISNHCERPDVQGLRDNLLALLAGRVHLVLSGHAHAFEWFRARPLLNTGFFVSGGGGQISLRPSLLEPRRLPRYRPRYEALRQHGVVECAVGGRGPAAADGADGPIYHFLRVEVTPDALRVCPVGVRRLARGYRREAPMPVYHAPDLPPTRPPWTPRRLEAVEIYRNQPPLACWR